MCNSISDPPFSPHRNIQQICSYEQAGIQSGTEFNHMLLETITYTQFNRQSGKQINIRVGKTASVSRQSSINMHSAGTEAHTSWSGGWKYWFSHNSRIISGRIWPNGCIGGFRGSPEGRMRIARKPEKAEAILARAC